MSSRGVPPMPEEFKRPDVIHIGHFAPLEEIKFKGACGEAFKDVLKCAERNNPKVEGQAGNPIVKAEADFERQAEQWAKVNEDGVLPDGTRPTLPRNVAMTEPTACKIEQRDLIECLHWNPDWPEQS